MINIVNSGWKCVKHYINPCTDTLISLSGRTLGSNVLWSCKSSSQLFKVCARSEDMKLVTVYQINHYQPLPLGYFY